MNTFRRFLLFPFALTAVAATVRAQTPYLETAPITILWNFTLTGSSGTTLGSTPTLPESSAPFNPGALRPIERITTEAGSLITYSAANGNQQHFADKLIVNSVKLYRAEAVRLQAAAAAQPDDSPAQLDLLKEAARFSTLATYLESETDGRWELTAVREAQTTVEGALNTPFRIFLTRIQPTSGRPSPTFLTDFRLQPISSVVNATETLYAGPATDTVEVGRVTKATGNAATIFLRVEFESGGNDGYWLTFGTAYLTCNIRSTPGPLAAVALSKPSITGHGTWVHITPDERYYTGIGPLAIKMGETKYQHKDMFPEFFSD
jgi:hypothetical protein